MKEFTFFGWIQSKWSYLQQRRCDNRNENGDRCRNQPQSSGPHLWSTERFKINKYSRCCRHNCKKAYTDNIIRIATWCNLSDKNQIEDSSGVESLIRLISFDWDAISHPIQPDFISRTSYISYLWVQDSPDICYDSHRALHRNHIRTWLCRPRSTIIKNINNFKNDKITLNIIGYRRCDDIILNQNNFGCLCMIVSEK